MNYPIRSAQDLGLVIRAARKAAGVRQDDLAGVVGVSTQFAVDAERGKPTIQLGKVLALLEELGVELSVALSQAELQALQRIRASRQAKDAAAAARGTTTP